MRQAAFLSILLGIFGLVSWGNAADAPKMRLSEYPFFVGKLSDQMPGERVFPYSVNAPLFSDHAEKARFFYLPTGGKMAFNPDSAFAMPVGAVLIKTFFYQKMDGTGRRLLETRLLLHEEKGWKALTYLWDAEQNDALLEVAGAVLPVEAMVLGKKRAFDYAVPNVNQCKNCHSNFGKIEPLGLTARQLGDAQLVPSARDQLVEWEKGGLLENFDPKNLPETLPDPLDENQPIDRRARAWLDANCGHCHRPGGPANTSGLFLDRRETDPHRLGVMKPPVAAGRGSGGRQFSIVPGRPEKSILVHRMESTDPGVMMPELGRSLRDEAGIELIRKWIAGMGD